MWIMRHPQSDVPRLARTTEHRDRLVAMGGTATELSPDLADLADRLAADGEDEFSVALSVGRAGSMHGASYVEHGDAGRWQSHCPACGATVRHASALARRDYLMMGAVCGTCAPVEPGAPGPMVGQHDVFTVRRGRTPEGKPTAKVTKYADWSVLGQTAADPTDEQVAALAAVGVRADDWRDIWADCMAHESPRRRRDGTMSGMALSRVADMALSVAGLTDDVPDRVGSAMALSWQQIVTVEPGATIHDARHRCGIAGYLASDQIPELETREATDVRRMVVGRRMIVVGAGEREISDSVSNERFSVTRQTLASLADAQTVPTVARIRPKTRIRLPRPTLRKSERCEPVSVLAPVLVRGDSRWSNIGPRRMTLRHLAGPKTDDGRIWVGHSLVERGATARSAAQDAANAARVFVGGRQVGALRAARSIGEIRVESVTESVMVTLAESIGLGQTVTWSHEASGTRGTISRGQSDRLSARVYAGPDVARVSGMRTAAGLATAVVRAAAT